MDFGLSSPSDESRTFCQLCTSFHQVQNCSSLEQSTVPSSAVVNSNVFNWSWGVVYKMAWLTNIAAGTHCTKACSSARIWEGILCEAKWYDCRVSIVAVLNRWKRVSLMRTTSVKFIFYGVNHLECWKEVKRKIPLNVGVNVLGCSPSVGVVCSN